MPWLNQMQEPHCRSSERVALGCIAPVTALNKEPAGVDDLVKTGEILWRYSVHNVGKHYRRTMRGFVIIVGPSFHLNPLAPNHHLSRKALQVDDRMPIDLPYVNRSPNSRLLALDDALCKMSLLPG